MEPEKTTLLTAQQEKIIGQQISAEQVGILYRQLKISIPTSFLCASLVFYALLKIDDPILLWSWYITVILISVLRFGLLVAYNHSPQKYQLHLNLFIIGTILTATCWGFAGSILIPPNSIPGQAVIIIILAGVSAGGLQTLMGSLISSILFVTLMIAPTAGWLLSRSGGAYELIGIALVAYLLFMLVISWRGYKILFKSLHLHHENLALIDSLKAANKNLETEIKASKKAQKRINHLATHDSLTDLLNRNALEMLFEQTIAQAKRDGKKFAVLFLDIDHFKTVNDSLGHALGDQLLVKTTQRLKKALRGTDIISRPGGDEFVFILQNIVDKKNVEDIIQKMYKNFASPFFLDNQQIMITVSIGISLYPEDGNTAQALLKKADVALYRAKEEGRNRYRFCQDS